MSIEAVRVVRQADGSATVDLVLLNPSVVSYNIASSKHTLTLDGRVVGKLVINEPLGLPAQGQASLSSPLLTDQGVALPAGPQASYRLETELKLNLYGDSVEYTKLSAAGTLTIVAK